MFKQKYEKLNNYITPDISLVNKVRTFNNSKNLKSIKIKNIALKPAIAMACLMTMFCSMPVLAANVPIIYDLMYLVSPSIAQHFMPIQKTDENNGIKMEVVSAKIEDEEVQIYMTLQDLAENRIDETADLNDSYSLNTAFECSVGHCQNIGYNDKTKKTTFMITLKDIENKKINNEKLTFRLNNFISHKDIWENIHLPINFKDNKVLETTEIKQFTGFSSTEEKYYNLGIDKIDHTVISPKYKIDFGVTDMKITGIGIINDKLHIQVSAKNNLKLDNHGEIYLKNKITNEIKSCNYKVSFILGEKENEYEYSTDYFSSDNKNRIDFTEYVYDVSAEELENYDFYGDFISGQENIKGEWQVTFPIEIN